MASNQNGTSALNDAEPRFTDFILTEDPAFCQEFFRLLHAVLAEAHALIEAALYGNPGLSVEARYAAFTTLQAEFGDQFAAIDAEIARCGALVLLACERARGRRRAQAEQAERRRWAEEEQAEDSRRAQAEQAERFRRAQEEQAEQGLRAQVEYERRTNAIWADEDARQSAGESMFICVTPHWFWQCCICGYSNELYSELRYHSRSWPSAHRWRMPCQNPAENIVRSNRYNSNSTLEPNNHICGHERCIWCIDRDEHMTPVRFGSGNAITREDHVEFWGWRFWAQSYGIPNDEVTLQEYESFCLRRFGGIPPLMPQEVILPQIDEHSSEQSAEQSSIHLELIDPELR